MGILFWFICSFSLSAQPAVDSSRLSGMLAKPLAVVLQRSGLSANVAVHEVEGVLRKGAHWTLYFIFGCLMFFFMRTIWGTQVNIKLWVLLVLVGVAIAALDEFHQFFVAGRSAQWKDVVLDSVGTIMGLVWCIWLRENEEERSE